MSDPFSLDRRHFERAFARAAATYENHDVLHREVEQELQSRLDFYLDKPARVVDLGAGTGRGAAVLKKRYGKAEVIAIDLSLPMLRRSRRSLLHPVARVVGDVTCLPLADHSVDVLHSNLCFQWCNDLDTLFSECERVLKPGGFFVFSMFGPDTLRELRAAWAEHDDAPHVSRFLDMHDVGDIVLNAGLYDPVLDVGRYTLTYDTPEGLLHDLKGLGATNADVTRRRTLTGKLRYRKMLDAYEKQRVDGRIPATWEIVTAHAWARREGQRLRLPIGVSAVGSTHLPAGAIRR